VNKKLLGGLVAVMLAVALPFAFAQVDPITSLYGAFVSNPGPSSSIAFLTDMNKLSAAGQADSHYIQQIGRSYDTAVHQADWRRFVDVTSNAGLSSWVLQSRIDAAAFTARLTVTDAGNVTVPGTLTVDGAQTLTGATTFTAAATFNGAVTLGDAAADNITVTGSFASNLIFAEDTARTIRPANQATAATAGDALTVQGGLGNTTGVGGALNLIGGAGGATDAVGGNVVITGGAAGVTNANGGDVAVDGGLKQGSGANGNVLLAGTRAAVKLGATSPMTITNIRIYTLTNVDLDTSDNSIAAHVCEDQSVAVTGLLATDNVICTMSTTDLAVTFNVMCHTPASNAITFRTCNNSASGADPGAVADFRIVAISGS